MTVGMQRTPWKRGLWLSLVLGLFWLFGCEPQTSDPTGGETHFLRVCTDDANACGSALSCLCGVCTVACQVEASCASFPEASCTARPSGTCGVAGNVCDLPCAADGDCAVLSAEHRCESGSCRLTPQPVGPGEGGAASTGGAPATGCTGGTVSANEVLILGDSFFATSHEITGYLEDLARGAGVLQAGERYRDQSRLVNNALALSSYGILDQYRTAAADAEVNVVIMNGGGADVLLGSCIAANASCPVVSAAAAAFDDLLLTMSEEGVTAVVFASYPDPLPTDVRPKMDALRPLLQASCEQSPVPCFFLDLREAFYGNYTEYVLADGMNPTAAGSQASAGAIWKVMQDNCLAQ